MKKLMVAFAAVAVAFCAQAVSVNWSVQGGIQIDGNWSTGYGNTVQSGWAMYLFDNSVVSRDSMITALTAGNSLEEFGKLTYADLQPALGDGKVSGVANLAVDGANNVNAYLVIIDAAAAAEGTHAFVSQINSTPSTDPVPTGLRIETEGDWVNALDHSIAGQAGSNWYTLQAVPEPTSGLLLLIGVAGLALRRRRA